MRLFLLHPERWLFIVIVVIAMTQLVANRSIVAMRKTGTPASLREKIKCYLITLFDWPLVVLHAAPAMLFSEKFRLQCGRELRQIIYLWVATVFVCALPYADGSIQNLGHNMLVGLGVSLTWFVAAYVVDGIVQGIKDHTIFEID